jgi:hypothetical protein
MEVSKSIQIVVSKVIERYVPEGRDPLLLVNRREIMESIILQLVERGILSGSLVAIADMSKNWEEVLHQRAAYAN